MTDSATRQSPCKATSGTSERGTRVELDQHERLDAPLDSTRLVPPAASAGCEPDIQAHLAAVLWASGC